MQKAKLLKEIDQMYRLLTWGEALLRSTSGWPSNHPNEVTEWREDWRRTRERIKKLQENRYD